MFHTLCCSAQPFSGIGRTAWKTTFFYFLAREALTSNESHKAAIEQMGRNTLVEQSRRVREAIVAVTQPGELG